MLLKPFEFERRSLLLPVKISGFDYQTGHHVYENNEARTGYKMSVYEAKLNIRQAKHESENHIYPLTYGLLDLYNVRELQVTYKEQEYKVFLNQNKKELDLGNKYSVPSSFLWTLNNPWGKGTLTVSQLFGILGKQGSVEFNILNDGKFIILGDI